MSCRRNATSPPATAPCLLGALLALSAALLSLPEGPADRPARAPEKFAGIEKLLKDAVDRKQVAGASALVSRSGKVVYRTTAGWQDIEAKKPLTDRTIFRIASMTKPITSAAVLMLVDDGKLRTSDPVSKYLPEFRNLRVLVVGKDGKATTQPARREITVHDLLTHTSGISYTFANRPRLGELYVKAGVSDGISDTPGTIADNVKRLAKLPLAHQPGTAFEYGLNTDVLGRLVEVVSGKTLAEFFRERLFDPLKMNDTYFILPRGKRDRLSALYTFGPDKALHRVGDKPVKMGTLTFSATYPIQDKGRYYSGGGGLVSTIDDYHNFLRLMLNRGELNGKRLLKPETVDRMMSNQIGKLSLGPGGVKFGYGFGVQEKDRPGGPSAGTYSWGGIFYTAFWVDPKQEVIGILMTQVFPNGHLKLREGFEKQVYAALEKE
jgi:CubicO group peptidase (beta-lactamase class C family)